MYLSAHRFTFLPKFGARASLAKLAALTLALCAGSRASAQTPVVFGDTITDPGVYFLAGNQTGGGDGILIDSDDVVLLLTRFTLRGDGTGSGIASDGHDNVQIYGGRVTNFEYGIGIIDGEYCTVQGTRIDHCSEVGLFVFDVFDSYFARLRCDQNGGNGVEALGAHDCRFVSILAHNNRQHGILLGATIKIADPVVGQGPYSEDNKIRLCWAAYNGLDGIRLSDADGNEIERNQCVANEDAGIRLTSILTDGTDSLGGEPSSQDNFLRSNWCVFNDEGIVVEWGSGDNTLTNNTALANFDADMVDRNHEVPCVNAWFLNFFLTKDGDGEDCIF